MRLPQQCEVFTICYQLLQTLNVTGILNLLHSTDPVLILHLFILFLFNLVFEVSL